MVAAVAHDSSPPPPLEVSAIHAASASHGASHGASLGGPPLEIEPCSAPGSDGPTTEPWTHRAPGFVVMSAGIGAVGFRDVAGFREAAQAAHDPRAAAPSRISLVGPDEEASAWLSSWAEDVEQVRRRLVVRCADGAEVTLVATIASFGEGIATSLAVESVGPLGGGAVLRSGVHSRAEVEAVLAHYERAHAGEAAPPIAETSQPRPAASPAATGETPARPADAP
jgi:hypothetical protein